jgi:hypothetical protein
MAPKLLLRFLVGAAYLIASTTAFAIEMQNNENIARKNFAIPNLTLKRIQRSDVLHDILEVDQNAIAGE